MHPALENAENGDHLVEYFYEPFSGASGAWKFMRVMRWGKPAQILAEVPAFLSEMLMLTLIFHGSRDPSIPEAFARRASSLMPNAEMVIVDSGHFVPLHQPESVATSLAQFFRHDHSALVTDT